MSSQVIHITTTNGREGVGCYAGMSEFQRDYHKQLIQDAQVDLIPMQHKNRCWLTVDRRGLKPGPFNILYRKDGEVQLVRLGVSRVLKHIV